MMKTFCFKCHTENPNIESTDDEIACISCGSIVGFYFSEKPEHIGKPEHTNFQISLKRIVNTIGFTILGFIVGLVLVFLFGCLFF